MDIELKGVRQNNLKNIDVKIPIGSFTVICGPSGSGKSSLAFDTLFAEGQRRYIECLSNYTKQFLNQAPKPDLDSVTNIPPALALEQKNSVRNSRSTVGTITEVTDYLRLLFEKIGTIYCPNHKSIIKTYSPSSASQEVLKEFDGQRGYVVIEILKNSRGLNQKDLLKKLQTDGYLRIIKKSKRAKKPTPIELDDPSIKKSGLPADTFYLIIDRLSFNKEDKGRLLDSLNQAYQAYLSFNPTEQYASCHVISVDNNHLHFSQKLSCTHCDFSFPNLSSQIFNFNNPLGACEECNGFGHTLLPDHDKVIQNPKLTIAQGVITPFAMPSAKSNRAKLIRFCERHKIDTHTPWEKLTQKKQQLIWDGDSKFYGINGLFAYLETKKYKMHVRVFLARHKKPVLCPECHGARLKKTTLNVKINKKNIAQLCELPIDQLINFFKTIKLTPKQKQIAQEALAQLQHRLQFLQNVGVDYLSLSRETKTLSGGEFQRLSLSNQLGMELSQTLFVLDEPTIGLHPRDNNKLIDVLHRLNNLGNTLVVVEHDHDVINNCNYLIEIGPESGHLGGEVMFSGPISEFRNVKESNTLPFLNVKKREPIRQLHPPSTKTMYLNIKGCQGHNLKKTDLKIPLNCIVGISGVSGSGKSSLITQTLYPALARELDVDYIKSLPFDSITGAKHLKSVLYIDQKSIGKTSRSNPASYLKIFDTIRILLSRTPEAIHRGYTPGTFSINVDGGRCPVCKGLGYEEIDMVFMDDLQIVCEECHGKRYRQDILEIKYKDKNALDILNMTAQEAYHFFSDHPKILKPLKILRDVGLSYLTLGQPSPSLSGGESQRIKIAKELSTSKQVNTLYILDEPTTGLHFKDVHLLIKVLDRLVETGSSVIVIEHNQEVLMNTDYIIDIGPEAGQHGGEVTAQGSVKEFVKKKSLTAKYLKSYLQGQ